MDTINSQHGVGCILDGARGQSANYVALIEMATDYGFAVEGWPGTDGVDVVIDGILSATPSWSDWSVSEREDYEHLGEVAEEALGWLNDTSNGALDEGYRLEWVDGDLFLVREEA